MSPETEFTWEEVLELADKLLFENTGRHIRDLEVLVLRGAWERKTYETIADECHITFKHIGEVGGELWKKLSAGLDEQVSKTNFREHLKREWQKRWLDCHPKTPLSNLSQLKSFISAEEPYIECVQTETRCAEEILKPGALLRIKAPLQFGKTALMSRIVRSVQQQGYRTVALNLRDAMPEDFTSLERFLQWFLTSIAQALELENSIDAHWRKSLGNSKMKCRTYFEKYLLLEESPLLITIDELDRLFPYQDIAGEFLGMLRTWHEDARTRPLWAQLRLIVLHTTVYAEQEITRSPFNAGAEVALQDLSLGQVQALSQQYDLSWDDTEIRSLMQLIGGHPYLVAKAFQVIAQKKLPLEALLETAPTVAGVYRDYLEQLWQKLESSQLQQTFGVVVTATSPKLNIDLTMEDAVKLHDIGLVEFQGQSVLPRYELYRQYFSQRFKGYATSR